LGDHRGGFGHPDFVRGLGSSRAGFFADMPGACWLGSVRVLRPVYDWLVARARSPRAIWWLCLVSFAESSFFPLPPDILLVPMALKTPSRMWFYATICSIASMFGGLLGYAIGYYLFTSIGQSLIEFYQAQDAFGRFQEAFRLYGPWFMILKGITPVPYKLLAIAAGFAKLDLTVFVLCSLVARFSRYYMVTALLWRYGPQIETLIEKRLMLATSLVLGVAVLGIVSLRMF
jgi:membrane protein YqaA with SNARE-associated domain